MTRASFNAFRQTVIVEWPKGQGADARKLLLDTAKAGHARILQAAPGKPSFTAFANTPGRPIEAVILPGPIVYRYSYLHEVIVAALDELRRASPIRSGRYRDSHTLFVNGIPVRGVPENLAPGDDVMISNPVPYARRLEIGKTESGRDFLVSVPNRVYERVAKGLSRRFGSAAVITFAYADLPGAYTTNAGLKPTYIAKGGRRRKRRQKAGTKVRAPAIVIALHR